MKSRMSAGFARLHLRGQQIDPEKTEIHVLACSVHSTPLLMSQSAQKNMMKT